MSVSGQCSLCNIELVVWLATIHQHDSTASSMALSLSYCHCPTVIVLLSVINPRCLMYKSLHELQLRKKLSWMLRLASHEEVVQPFFLLGQLLWLVEYLLNQASLVPRPHPAFHCFQYCKQRKSGRGLRTRLKSGLLLLYIKWLSHDSSFILCVSQFSMSEKLNEQIYSRGWKGKSKSHLPTLAGPLESSQNPLCVHCGVFWWPPVTWQSIRSFQKTLIKPGHAKLVLVFPLSLVPQRRVRVSLCVHCGEPTPVNCQVPSERTTQDM